MPPLAENKAASLGVATCFLQFPVSLWASRWKVGALRTGSLHPYRQTCPARERLALGKGPQARPLEGHQGAGDSKLLPQNTPSTDEEDGSGKL